MKRAILTEWWKFRRSIVVATTSLLLASAMPGMAVGFSLAAASGSDTAVGRKAAALIVGEGWEAYLGAVSQISAVAGLLGAGVVSGWVFAREHADRTFPSLFALPVSRSSIAGAKFVVLIGWVLVLTLVVTATTVGVGVIASVGPELSIGDVGRLALVLVGSGTLGTTAAFAASVGRGYLPAIGFLVIVIAVSQIAVLLGGGAWFPFAVPGLAAVSEVPDMPSLGVRHAVLVCATVAVGMAATVTWWRASEVR